MPQPLTYLSETASQTAGPYVHIGCAPNFVGINGIYAEDMGRTPFGADVTGEAITISGAIHDATGAVLRDAMIETWQAGPDGTFGPGTQGHARIVADLATGDWTLNTLKPGAIATREGVIQAPHIAVWIVARGINLGLSTRIYFEGDDHSTDSLLSRIEHRHRVPTLIAKSAGPGQYRFDVHLQGANETVFLDI